MSIRRWSCAAIVFLGACGDDAKPQPARTGKAGQPAAGKPAVGRPDPVADEGARPDSGPTDTAALEAARREVARLTKLVLERDRALGDLIAAHAKEMEGLGDATSIRSAYRRQVPQLNRANASVGLLKRRLDKLAKAVGASEQGELAKLRKERLALEQEYEDTVSFRKREAATADIGGVQASPVKAELDLLRAIKYRWLARTADVRRGRLDAGRRKSVGESFRRWATGDERVNAIIGAVLAQEVAPKGKTPANFDYSDLDFFILLEIYENELDKKNIEQEKRAQFALQDKERSVRARIDALDDRIGELLDEDGGDLGEYEDVKTRYENAIARRDQIAAQVSVYSNLLDPIREAERRHAQADQEASDALEQARRELADAKAKLRQLG